jgi:uncharacterized protein (UPF0262 family)
MAEEPSKRIKEIRLDEKSVVRRNSDVEHERAVAIFDLLEDNSFSLVSGREGPYCVVLRLEEDRLVLDVADEKEEPLETIALSVKPFRRVIKDYFSVCESYFEAIKTASPSRIEAIDMGRRGLHNEGSDMLRDRLEEKVAIDFDTARRLFTLLCVLHIRG